MNKIILLPHLKKHLAERYVISDLSEQSPMSGRGYFTGELLLEVKDGKVIKVKKRPAKREE